jgi:hypothetical protein
MFSNISTTQLGECEQQEASRAEAENLERSEQPELPHALLSLCVTVTKSIFICQMLPNADFVLEIYIEII